MRYTRIPAAMLRKALHCKAGGTLTLTAVVFPAVLGFSGLALDGAHWYQQRRDTQSMVDAAAVAGAYAKLDEETLDQIRSVVRAEAVRNGYEDVAANEILVVDVSGSGGNGVSAPLIDVVIRRSVPLYFAGLFLESRSTTIAARALSGVRNLGPQCVIALDETASRAVEFSGSASADIGCGVASNSDSDEALFISGDAILQANPAQAFGDIAIEGAGTLISELPPLPFSPRVDDPFADLPAPPSPPCDLTASGNQPVTVSDSADIVDSNGDGFTTFCGGLELSGTLTIDPGTLVIRNGDFTTKGNTNVSGAEVTVMLTGDAPSDVGNVHLNNNTVMDLSAPTSGPYQGLLIYQDPKAENPDDSVFNGGVNLSLDGAIYMPKGHIQFSGGADNPNNCLQIVSRTVTFTGNSFIRNNPTVCQDLGLADGGSTQRQVVLLE